MNPKATEYSKSSTDDEAARQEEAAFDPNLTDPDSQKKKAGEKTGVSIHCELGPTSGLLAIISPSDCQSIGLRVDFPSCPVIFLVRRSTWWISSHDELKKSEMLILRLF